LALPSLMEFVHCVPLLLCNSRPARHHAFVTRVRSESERAEMRRLMLEAVQQRQASASSSTGPAAAAGDAAAASAALPQLARPPSVNMIQFN
jgi:hypothetical protein